MTEDFTLQTLKVNGLHICPESMKTETNQDNVIFCAMRQIHLLCTPSVWRRAPTFLLPR